MRKLGRALAAALVILTMISGVALANLNFPDPVFTVDSVTVTSVALVKGEGSKTVTVTMSGNGNTGKPGEAGYLMTYPTSVTFTATGASVNSDATYDWAGQDKTFSFSITVNATADAVNRTINLYAASYMSFESKLGTSGAANLTAVVEAAAPPTYTVIFGVGTGLGTLEAAVGGVPINSGDAVTEGTTIVFTAAPALGYEVHTWDTVGTYNWNTAGFPNVFICTNLDQNTTVTVNFKLALEAPSVTDHPANRSITYGQDATFTAAASGVPDPTVQWEVSADEGASWSNVPGATSGTLTLTQPPVADSGNWYRAIFTNSQGSATTSHATLTVGKAIATVDLSDLVHTYDGTPKAATVVTDPTGLTVTVTYDGNTAQPTNAGDYTVVATVEDDNYAGDTSGTLTIDKATPLVSQWPTAEPITYGDTLAASSLAGGSTAVEGSFDFTNSAAKPSAAGTYSASVTFTPTDTTNFNSVIGSVDVTVNPKDLTITASNRGKTYGDAVTFLGTEFIAVGLVAGDAITSVTLVSAGATAFAPVVDSPYDIVPSAPVGIVVTNYNITFVDGELTVSTAALTITADNQTKTYGETLIFDGTEFAVTGLLGTDAVDSATIVSAGAEATASVDGPPYTIAISDAVGTGLSNYTITYVPGSLTVNKATPTVDPWPTASPITYGQALSDSSFIGGTTSVPGSFEFDNPAHTPVAGTYTADVTFVPTDGVNYNSVRGTVSVTVNKKSLTVTADDKEKVYDGNPFSPFTVSYSGFVLGQDETVLDGALDFEGDAVGAVEPGSYTITPKGLTSDNYSISYLPGTLVIRKIPTAITYTGAHGLLPLRQYSDPAGLKARLLAGGHAMDDETLTFTLGSQVITGQTNASGVAEPFLLLNQAPGTKTLTVSYAGDAHHEACSITVSYLVSPERALVDYTGETSITIGDKATSVTVPVTVRVTDYNDGHRGDIRNAKVKIMIMENLSVRASTAWLPVVTVLDPSNPVEGLVSATLTFSAPKDPAIYNVVVAVDGWYGGADIQCAAISVARGSLTDHVTGGGYLVAENSGGQYAADAGTKVNFGFNLKWNKNRTNIQGNANIILRRLETVEMGLDPETGDPILEEVLKVYQIKTNSTLGMFVDDTTGTFYSRANLNDVTEATTINVASNCRIDMWFTDGGNGKDAEADKIGFALWSSSGELLFSSNWSHGTTEKQELDGGNVTIHNGK